MKTKKQQTAGATKVIKFQPIIKSVLTVGAKTIILPLLPNPNYFTIA